MHRIDHSIFSKIPDYFDKSNAIKLSFVNSTFNMLCFAYEELERTLLAISKKEFDRQRHTPLPRELFFPLLPHMLSFIDNFKRFNAAINSLKIHHPTNQEIPSELQSIDFNFDEQKIFKFLENQQDEILKLRDTVQHIYNQLGNILNNEEYDSSSLLGHIGWCFIPSKKSNNLKKFVLTTGLIYSPKIDALNAHSMKKKPIKGPIFNIEYKIRGKLYDISSAFFELRELFGEFANSLTAYVHSKVSTLLNGEEPNYIAQSYLCMFEIPLTSPPTAFEPTEQAQ